MRFFIIKEKKLTDSSLRSPRAAELFKTTKAGDSGLGLSVVQQIVSAHNGATFTAISQQQPS
jgi:signal transduction histidine kinase